MEVIHSVYSSIVISPSGKRRKHNDLHSVRRNCPVVLDVVKMDKERVY
jgi:hypothetical protein